MQRHRRRIELLQRLARLREVERLGAAASAAEAQGAHGKLTQLHARSGEIAASYAARADAADGAALAAQMQFLCGIGAIVRDTRVAEAEAARAADAARLKMLQAERRRDRVSEYLGAERRAADRLDLARQSMAAASLARKLKGSR